MEQGSFRDARSDLKRALDIREGGNPGRKDQWPSKACGGAEKGKMIELRRGDFNAGRFKAFKFREAFKAKGACKKDKTPGTAVTRDFCVKAGVNFEFTETFKKGNPPAREIDESGIGMKNFVRIDYLEFRGVGAGFAHGVHEFFGFIERAIVPCSDFRDYHRLFARAKRAAFDPEFPLTHALIVSRDTLLSR
jgi:hypothetical protein